jgi:hypothetical protein
VLLANIRFDGEFDPEVGRDDGPGLMGPHEWTRYYQVRLVALRDIFGHRLRLAAPQFRQRRQMVGEPPVAIALALAVADQDESGYGGVHGEGPAPLNILILSDAAIGLIRYGRIEILVQKLILGPWAVDRKKLVPIPLGKVHLHTGTYASLFICDTKKLGKICLTGSWNYRKSVTTPGVTRLWNSPNCARPSWPAHTST